MEMLLMLLCVAGLSFFLKEMNGPFNLMGRARSLLMNVPVVGPMLFHLMECSFCLGFWVSAMLCVLTNSFFSLSLTDFFVWSFAGAMFNLLVSRLMSKLES